jgi:hypothetical protein
MQLLLRDAARPGRSRLTSRVAGAVRSGHISASTHEVLQLSGPPLQCAFGGALVFSPAVALTLQI